jgi:hypothetical protein
MNIKIEIEGNSGHLEFGKLTSSELLEIYNEHQEDPEDLDNIYLLSGGMFPYEASSIYYDDLEHLKGNDFDIRVTGGSSGEDIDLDLDSVTFERAEYISEDGAKGGELYYAKLIDTDDTMIISIETDSKEDFDPSKLTLQYLEFEFESGMERCGKILSGATYDKEPCEIDYAGSNTKSTAIQIIGYVCYDGYDDEQPELEICLSLNDGGCSKDDPDDSFVVLESDGYETTWNWEGVEKYLASKSKAEPKAKPETTESNDTFAPTDPVVLIKISRNYKETSTPEEIYEMTTPLSPHESPFDHLTQKANS